MDCHISIFFPICLVLFYYKLTFTPHMLSTIQYLITRVQYYTVRFPLNETGNQVQIEIKGYLFTCLLRYVQGTYI